MSDEWGAQEGDAAVAGGSPGPTAGALLRQAREAAGLHVAALAVALKVPVRKLEALEDDRYDLMTDSVFIRGLAASVCRTLKIDPQPILDRLPQRAAPRLVRDDDGINTPFRAPSDGPPANWTEQLTKPVYLAVFALLLGALVLILLPHRDDAAKSPVKSATETASPPVMPALLPAPALASIPADPAPSLTTTASMPAPVPLRTATPPDSAPAGAAPPAVTAAVTPAVTPAVSAAPALPLPATATAPAAPSPVLAIAPTAVAPAPVVGLVVFRAKGATWVEVTDAKGAVALRKVLAPGESAAANGALPLRVTVGRIDQTEVQVRGKPFDLQPHARGENVARFQVK